MTKLWIVICALVTVGHGQYNNNNCDPGICGRIPGLFYNADLDQCAWPDEVGCSLRDLGYNTDCSDAVAFDLKPTNFEVADLPEDRAQNQYFLVCVPATTDEDVRARSLFPSGPLEPRLLGCPGSQIYNPETKCCEG